MKNLIKYLISCGFFIVFILSFITLLNNAEGIVTISLTFISLHLSLSLSPLFDYICKKTNKSFSLSKKLLFILVPSSIFVIMFLMNGLFSTLWIFLNPNSFLVLLIILLYLTSCILFFIFNKHEYKEKQKSKVNEILLIIVTYIILIGVLSYIIFKCLLVNIINDYLVINGIQKNDETLVINAKSINNDESYIVLENIKMRYDYTSNYINDEIKNIIVLEDNKNIYYRKYNDIFLKSEGIFKYAYNDLDTEYELYDSIYSIEKTQLNIYDDLKTILLIFDKIRSANIIKIEFEDYKGFIFNNEKYYTLKLYNLDKNIAYSISFQNYTKEEVIDLISTIKINEEYIEEINEVPIIYLNEEDLKDYNNAKYVIDGKTYKYLSKFYKNIDSLDIKCVNHYCNTGTLILANNDYDLNNYEILYHTNFMLLINHYEDYNTLQIFDKDGVEVVDVTYQEIVKIGDIYKPYSIRYKDGIFYYYEYINGEYIHKTIDTNYNYIIENYNN